MEDRVFEALRQFVGRSDRDELEPRLQRALVEQSMDGHHSHRVTHNVPGLARGLVVIEEGVIPDYARVRRVFHLTNAITKYYYSPFYIEEQVPGYHARVAWSGGRRVAFRRDGGYCAFATDRAGEFIPDELFADHPNLVVCLTIGGQGIPYAKPSYRGAAEDIEAWGTEVLELGVREPIATADKYALFEKYGVPVAPHVGPLQPFEPAELEELLAWMRERDAAGSQGLVLKPSERHHRPLKYALPSALCHAAPAWLGLDDSIEEDSHFERLVQSACAATELGVAADGLDWEGAGRALLEELAAAAATVAEGVTLSREFSVWLHTEGAAKELLAQLQARLSDTAIESLGLEPDGDGWRLRFRRRFADATAILERRLSGASYRD